VAASPGSSGSGAGNGADVVIVGAGLAGGLLALELLGRGLSVLLLEAGGPAAGPFSYGIIPGWPLASTPLARRVAGAARRWRTLQNLHGDLGWRPLGWHPLPLSQVDTARWSERWPGVLAAAGGEQRRARVIRLERLPCGGRLLLDNGPPLTAARVVLAAGAGCLDLGLGSLLPPQLQRSWAGLLELPPAAADARAGYRISLPRRFQRLELERRSGQLTESAWVVDAGLVPRGAGALLGQLSWVTPGWGMGGEGQGPPPQAAESWLRQSLSASAPPPLAALAGGGSYRQVPVAFCSDGRPRVGPLPGAHGLWLFSGFGGGFAQAPVLAPLLADVIAGGPPGQRAAAVLQQCL
jgi:glycine/D-amino acid oxidase-like deaminating enzyme